ncbi:MAG: hypothetical protein P8Y54_07910 [Xanthomonadales bacterium]
MSRKQDYERKMAAQLREWQAKIDLLKARAEKAGAEQKIAYHEQIENLRAHQRKARDRFEELRDAGEDAWDQLVDGLESAGSELKDALRRAGEKLRDV